MEHIPNQRFAKTSCAAKQKLFYNALMNTQNRTTTNMIAPAAPAGVGSRAAIAAAASAAAANAAAAAA